ncbi:hypothetical protein SASPL_141842 [Salvia splendens]|uniref:Uncharacterized protein n=1 Tax=Salvia splendens TaxID=180675 RepID=A0A8X8WKA5_SALSN|nr:hypothetical protein SASPL_141842 [Salvia splendens]
MAVAIQNYVKCLAALTGLTGGSSYWFYHDMKSKYGEKYPDTFTTFMTGHVAFAAGATAHLLYVINKNLALVGDMDKKALAALTIRKSPTTFLMYTAGNVMLVASRLSSFEKDLLKTTTKLEKSQSEIFILLFFQILFSFPWFPFQLLGYE